MIRILDAQTTQLLGQVMMDDILKAGHLSEAHLRLLVDKIHVHEEDGKRSLDICLKAPFRDHLDIYKKGEQTECWVPHSYGFELLEKLGKGVGIMTHCNAGTLATAKYGTALAPMYIALEHGWDPKKDLHVYCDETRPLLQGARLSAYEMQAAGIDTYVQCDNMASYTMKSDKIGIIFVGCDRVAANGDFANKIGTSGVAIIAKHYGVPFYVCAPSSTIDMTLESGDEIHIEQRKSEEVTEMWYKERMAPEGVGVVNPAFDVTDHSLVTGIITEKGIAYEPFKESFEKMGIKPVEKYVDKK